MRIVPSGDFGLVGLAVMGQNLILNIADHDFTIVVFNRTVSKVDHFLDNEAKGRLELELLVLVIFRRLIRVCDREYSHRWNAFYGRILFEA